jgi:(p)ppGpp synthase/HD superfamily hydrolase
LARPFGGDAEAAAYLHDVKEDVAGMSLDALRERFGSEVSEAVDLLSDPPGATRKERKAKAYARLAVTENRLALIVKPCDRLANMRACVADGNERLLEVSRSARPIARACAMRSGPHWTSLRSSRSPQAPKGPRLADERPLLLRVP